MSGVVAARVANWELDVSDLPEVRVGFQDGLIIGSFPQPLDSTSHGQNMLLCDVAEVPADVMVGAGIGVMQLSTVGLVMLHSRYTPLLQSRVAWAVGIRLRRRRLLAGADPRLVMTGARPPADLIPDGVWLIGHRVRLLDGDRDRVGNGDGLVDVWEVVFPATIERPRHR